MGFHVTTAAAVAEAWECNEGLTRSFGFNMVFIAFVSLSVSP